MRVKFTADYNHRWPSRAVTAFKAGYEGTVKREVGSVAVSLGKATELPAPARADGDALDDDGRTDALVGVDPRSDDVSGAGGRRGRRVRDSDRTGPALGGDRSLDDDR